MIRHHRLCTVARPRPGLARTCPCAGRSKNRPTTSGLVFQRDEGSRARTLQPFGQIPTYEGDLVLFESERSCSTSPGIMPACCRGTRAQGARHHVDVRRAQRWEPPIVELQTPCTRSTTSPGMRSACCRRDRIRVRLDDLSTGLGRRLARRYVQRRRPLDGASAQAGGRSRRNIRGSPPMSPAVRGRRSSVLKLSWRFSRSLATTSLTWAIPIHFP